MSLGGCCSPSELSIPTWYRQKKQKKNYQLILFEFFNNSSSQTSLHLWFSGAIHWGTSRKVPGSSPGGITGIFNWHYGPGVDWTSERNGYQQYFLAASVEHRQPNHLHVPVVWKPGSLNFLQPSWSVQACPGIDLSQMKVPWSSIATNTMLHDVLLVILATAMCREALKIY